MLTNAKMQEESSHMEQQTWPVTEEDGFCARFDRIDASLIEEQETCGVCRFFHDRDDTCRYPEVQQ